MMRNKKQPNAPAGKSASHKNGKRLVSAANMPLSKRSPNKSESRETPPKRVSRGADEEME
jgi:hypothetical protein